MDRSVNKQNTLDRFGPLGSALGSLFGFFLLSYSITYLQELRANNPFIGLLDFFYVPIFTYLFNTCTHRKFIILSKAAFAGAIGSIIGGIIGLGVSYLGLMITGFGYGALIPWAITIMIFSAFFSWITCRNQRKKEYLQNPSIYPPPKPIPLFTIGWDYPNKQQIIVKCRYCDANLASTPICPNCGRRNL